MNVTSEILDLLMDTPEAFKILEKAQDMLRNEQKKREEFYNWVTDDLKVEFINGEIIVHSPVKSSHAQASENLFRILSIYALKHQLGRVTHEKVMARFTRNDYEPDVMFFSKEKADSIQPNQSLFPVPDFVIEVLSDSTAERDRGVKFRDYEAHQVSEYWLVDVENQTVEQFVIKNGQYELIKKTDEGFIHCSVLKGLDLPVEFLTNKNNLSLYRK
ncbi:MAG: Uma2 family endonuclease [Spirosomaceae bacterium]|nr:Uma2 family endonuclease [Spirosomataceae bacterium]